MKIFITGATGFIGKHLVNRFVKEGFDITINLYGNETSPFKENVYIHRLTENKIEQDIKFFEKGKFDGIVHLASLYLTTHKPDETVKLIDSNVRFGIHVLESAAQSGVKWFINTGTFWQHYNNAKYSPVNLYAASKQAFESIAQYYWETNQIKFCTLKLSDTYGPDDTRPKIFNLWERINKTGETLDMSPGEQIIDISHVDDIVSAFALLAKHLSNGHPKVKNGQTFAVKADKRYTLKELAKVFENCTGKKLNINWGGRYYREREVMDPWKNGVCVPEWKPKVPIEEGILSIMKDESIGK
ncbi:MAG: NAD(P)-dependent oxidoreductase [Lentimicrobiaceae bacterium]|nr:NAD(P)-dependent oxidoreductase [Lentimicrobiaceae bacterium]